MAEIEDILLRWCGRSLDCGSGEPCVGFPLDAKALLTALRSASVCMIVLGPPAFGELPTSVDFLLVAVDLASAVLEICF